MPGTFTVNLTVFEAGAVRVPGSPVIVPRGALRSRLWAANLWASPRRRPRGAFEDGLYMLILRAPWTRRRSAGA